jgi:hypothetical protein
MGTNMLAREKWQIKTIRALELVFNERCRQMLLHGDAMAHLPDGTGPDTEWLSPLSNVPAWEAQQDFRDDYESRLYTCGSCGFKTAIRGDIKNHAAALGHHGWEDNGQLTKMHLIREELAEAFELAGDDPSFVEEILQVAALCVQWAELKMEEVVP